MKQLWKVTIRVTWKYHTGYPHKDIEFYGLASSINGAVQKAIWATKRMDNVRRCHPIAAEKIADRDF